MAITPDKTVENWEYSVANYIESIVVVFDDILCKHGYKFDLKNGANFVHIINCGDRDIWNIITDEVEYPKYYFTTRQKQEWFFKKMISIYSQVGWKVSFNISDSTISFCRSDKVINNTVVVNNGNEITRSDLLDIDNVSE